MIYRAMRSLSNPRKILIFDVLFGRGKLTTWDVYQTEGVKDKLGYVNDTVREFERLELVKFLGKQRPVDQEARQRTPSEETQYKCYEITPLGKMVHTLCASASSESPYSEFLAKVNPKDIVSEYAKIDKARLRELLSGLAGMRHLGALLLTLYYSKDETSDVGKLGERVDLDPLDVADILDKYLGELVEVERGPPSLVEKVGLFITRLRGDSKQVQEYKKTLGLEYSLTDRGRTIARTLDDSLYPEDLGIDTGELETYPKGIIDTLGYGFISAGAAYISYLGLTQLVDRVATALQFGFDKVGLADLLGPLVLGLLFGAGSVYLAYRFIFFLRLYFRHRAIS